MYRSDKNRGLPTNFQLVPSKDGKFKFGMVGGPVKCQDNMKMLLAFGNWFRFYKMDFCVNLGWLLQKNTNFILTFKTVTLGQFMQAADKYCPFIKVRKGNVYNNLNDRKELNIAIEYTYTLEPDSKYQFTEIINP